MCVDNSGLFSTHELNIGFQCSERCHLVVITIVVVIIAATGQLDCQWKWDRRTTWQNTGKWNLSLNVFFKICFSICGLERGMYLLKNLWKSLMTQSPIRMHFDYISLIFLLLLWWLLRMHLDLVFTQQQLSFKCSPHACVVSRIRLQWTFSSINHNWDNWMKSVKRVLRGKLVTKCVKDISQTDTLGLVWTQKHRQKKMHQSYNSTFLLFGPK